MRWVVQGEKYTDEGWVAFESVYPGETKADARWAARRAHAPGNRLAEIEDMPPNPEREKVEIQDPDNLRVDRRTGVDRREYERLVHGVRILSVEEASE